MKKKKLISGLLAVAMVTIAAFPAYAAETTAYHDGQNSIVLSDSVAQENTTLTLDGKAVSATFYTVQVGTTFSLTGDRSNLGEVGRKVYEEQSNGTYVSTQLSGSAIDNFWKATSDLSGKLVQIFSEDFSESTDGENPRVVEAYFFVKGNSQTQSGSSNAGTSTGASTVTYKSDTSAKVSLGTGSTYQFKVTSLNGKKPTFTVGGNSFKVTPNGNKGKDYYYKVTATGKNGDSAGVYINGSKTPSTILSISNMVKIDTGKKLTVKAGKTYQFKITSHAKPTFVSGNFKIFKVTYNGKSGNNYFYQVKAVGKTGQGTGFYLNGSKTPVTVGTIG